MKRQAKASSVRPISSRGSVLGFVRRAFATRGAFGDASGSGAPAYASALGLVALLLLVLAPVAQGKVVVGGFGTTGGTLGGQVPTPRGIAVNNSGNGGVAKGTTYVVDGNRIQRFSPAGAFDRAWGQNVAGRDERQQVTVANATGGTFTLSFGGKTTGNLAFNASTAQVQTALTGLTSIGAGNAAVSGSAGNYTVRFTGTLSGTDVAQLTGSAAALTGPTVTTTPPAVNISTIENGSGGNTVGFEICTAAASCQDALATPPTTANGGAMNAPQGVAVNQENGHVYVTDQGGRRIQEFDADGNFVRLWGWDVIATGKPNDKGTAAFEVCDTTAGNVAADCKTAAAAGTGAGQFGATMGYPAVDAANNVWVPDQANARLQVFSPTGAFLKMAGGDVVTDGAEGTGTLNSANTTVSALTTTSKFFEVGQTVTSSGGSIPAGTTIVSCTPNCLNATGLTLSQKPTASGAQTITAAPGAANVPTNEKQTITVTSPSTGKFSLSFNGQVTGATGTANWAKGSKILTEVVTKTGEFKVGMDISTAFGAADPETTITAIDTGAKTITVSKTHNSSNELNNLAVSGHDLAPTGGAAEIQTALGALSTVGAGNVAVSGPNGGPWVVEFKGRFADTDVPQLTSPAGNGGTTRTVAFSSANAFEVCSLASECRAGSAGTTPGQFAAAAPGDLAFDSGGNLYALDGGNARVQKFDSTLASVAGFGASALAPFTSAAPERMTASQSGTRIDLAVNNATAGERQIVELDTTGAFKEADLVGSGLNNISGLAADNTSGNLYATTTAATSPRVVLTLNAPLADPAIAINTVGTKADTTATFSGSVDPKGGLVSCKFQYSTDQVSWTDVPVPGCDSLAPGGGSQAISVNATGLVPATHYFVRLSVSRPLVAGSTKATGVKAFDTDGVPPVVSNVGAVNVADTSARVAASINPRNSETSYVIQYGTSPSLGTSTAPLSVGAGTTPIVVSQVLGGLSPATTYYFRVVASNLSGSTNSATLSFKTRAEALPLPDNRAYEMVSPPEKNGGGALSGSNNATVADDGDAVFFLSTSLFGEPTGVQAFRWAPYVSARGSGSWFTNPASPQVCRADIDGSSNSGVAQLYTLSPNLRLSAVTTPEFESCSIPPLDPAAPIPATNLYRQDLSTPTPAYTLLTPTAGFESGSSKFSGVGVASSHDFSHMLYVSTGNQTVDAPAPGNFNKLYDWSEGSISLLSKDPSGNPFTTATNVGGGGGNAAQNNEVTNSVGAVSDDGGRVYMQNPVGSAGKCTATNCELYLREGNSVTHHASLSECTSACGASQPDVFALADADGGKALFTSAAKLTDDVTSSAGANLYLFTVGANPASEPHNLTLLSRDDEPADTTNPDVIGVLGMGDDGETVYFVANGQIVSGSSTAPGPKVYRWRWNGGSPSVDYLATLATGDSRNWNGLLNSPQEDTRVTPDGGYLLISTTQALTPAADTDTDADLYRWAQASGWVCVTCQAPGVPSGGAATGPDTVPNRRHITISDDGQRVFFLTPEARVPQDVNGTVKDVYEWNDGTVSLISSGTDVSDVKLLGASDDGDDVFFYTAERLVGWDVDEIGDIYDARVGGGYPEPEPGKPTCEGEACRGPSTQPPTASGAGSAVFEGPGNREEPASCPKGTRKVTKGDKTFCKKKKKAKKKHNRNQKKHRKGKKAGNDRRAGK